jgi:hypothetical protein
MLVPQWIKIKNIKKDAYQRIRGLLVLGVLGHPALEPLSHARNRLEPACRGVHVCRRDLNANIASSLVHVDIFQFT